MLAEIHVKYNHKMNLLYYRTTLEFVYACRYSIMCQENCDLSPDLKTVSNMFFFCFSVCLLELRAATNSAAKTPEPSCSKHR